MKHPDRRLSEFGISCFEFPSDFAAVEFERGRISNFPPVVLYRDFRQKGQRVVFCCDLARRCGVEPGLTVAETKALLEVSPRRRRSAPVIAEDDPAANLAALRDLAVRCRRYSPVVGVDDTPEPDSLLLDITGCEHLFGGEKQLSRQLTDDLHRQGYRVQTAIADTVGAAWGMARFSPAGVARPESSKGVVGGRETLATPFPKPQGVPPVPTSDLSPLPVTALRLDPDTVATLHELDVRTVGQLQALPRSTLPSRLGPDVLRRLDQAFGQLPEAITPVMPDEPLAIRRDFDPPLTDRRGVSLAVGQLLRCLLTKLAARNAGALRLLVRLMNADPLPTSDLRPPTSDLRPTELTVAAHQPTASIDRWRELFDLQLERTPLPAEVHGLGLTVAAQAPLGSRQSEFFESGPVEGSSQGFPKSLGTSNSDNSELTRLLERLSNRLGEERVVRPRLLPEEQPEYAVCWEPLLATASSQGFPKSLGTSNAARPLRLEPAPLPVEVTSVVPDGPPIRLHWESVPRSGIRKNSEVGGHPSELLRVQLPRCWGPERIETGWWRGLHVRRDYYRVETDDGRHLWLFRDPDGAWFLHGTFE